MYDEIEEKTVILPPFKHFIMTVGEIPTSYVETMTYYEMLVWFTNYLGKTVIPAINENGEAVTELQNLFVELQNYVNNYFDNLDVQDEINNKLDALVEDGTMDQIINQQIFGELTSKKTIFIGDSYMYGATPQGTITSFITALKNKLGLSNEDAYVYCERGAGFVGKSETYNKNFADLIAEAVADIPSADRHLIKNIYILGGYNDRGSQPSTIQAAMQTQISGLKYYFPNAKIYVGMIGNDANNSVDGRVARNNLFTNSLQAYKKANDYGALYLTNSEHIMKEYILFASDGIHPNANGHTKLANGLFQIITTGNYTHKDGLYTNTITSPNYTGTFTYYNIAINGMLFGRIEAGSITLNESVTNNPSSGVTIDLGACDARYTRNVFNRSLATIPIRLFDTANHYYNFNAQLSYSDDGHYKLYILTDLTDTTIAFNKVQFLENSFNINLVNV